MLKGIDIRQRIDFVSSLDIGEPKTVFVLRPLSKLQMTIFSTINDRDSEEALNFYLERTIVEVKNFDTDNIKEAIAMLDSDTLGELIMKANQLNNVSKEEAKNS